MTSTLKKALDSYVLANGISENYNLTQVLDVDIPCSIQTAGNPVFVCKDFVYEIYCLTSQCTINAFRYKKNDYSDMRTHYALSHDRSNNGEWTTQCIYYEEDLGKSICESMPNVTLLHWQL